MTLIDSAPATELDAYHNPDGTLNLAAVRADFPILNQTVHGHPLVYLDSTATSLRPEQVIAAMERYYREYNANIHRGVYWMSEEATAQYEKARSKVAHFVNARSSKEIIFVRNATEGLNLVAYTWGRANLKPGDLIVLTAMEHHSNIVPWQRLAEEKGARLEYVSFDEQGLLKMDEWERLLAQKPRLVSFTHMSNVLGTINPAAEMTRQAHAAGAVVVVDAAQSAAHLPLDVQALDCDFLAFSGHKMCGPTGIGVLYGKRALLEAMPPFMGGGDMIREVHFDRSTWNDLPWKFEAGTPAIAEGIGLGAAFDYLNTLGMAAIARHEHTLVSYALDRLTAMPGVTVYGPGADKRGGVIAFNLEGIHPHDVASILDQHGVAVRAGHHCAQPLCEVLARFDPKVARFDAAARASFYIYNQLSDVDALVEAIQAAQKIFA